MTKCSFCEKIKEFYWNKKSGERLGLCEEHYNEMERAVHQKEKRNRLISAVVGVVSGKEYQRISCPNGDDCKFCMELGLSAKVGKKLSIALENEEDFIHQSLTNKEVVEVNKKVDDKIRKEL